MNFKAQDIPTEKIEKVFNNLPPKVKTVVVVLGMGTAFFFSVSEACKSATTFAKEGVPPIVEGFNMLKHGSADMIVDEPCERRIVDESSAA